MPEPSSSLDDALADQQALLEDSLPLVFEAFDESLGRKVSEPVVILLDCEDAIGGEIARGWLGDEAVEDAIADQAARDPKGEETTVFALGFPLGECRREIPPVFPYLAEGLQESAGRGAFWAISVTSGGASLLRVPLDARPTP